MTKRQYLKQLKMALGNIPAPEKEGVIEYYDELIEEAKGDGKTEEEIFAELDTPEQAAQNYLRESDGMERRRNAVKRDSAARIGRVFGVIGLSILGFILGVLTFSFLITIGTVGLVAVYVLLSSVGILFRGHVGIAFAQFGVTLTMVGICVLLVIIVILLWKFNIFLWTKLFGKGFGTARVRKGTLITLAASGGALVLGGLIFFTSFAAMGLKPQRLAVTKDIVVQERVIEANSENFTFESDNLAVTVRKSEDESMKIVYRETKENPRFYKYEDGKLTVKEHEGFSLGNLFTDNQWRRGIFFNVVARDFDEAELYLPASFVGDLTFKTSNGAILISDMVCSDLVLETDNGAISAHGLTVNSLQVKSSNGAIHINNVQVEDRVFAKTQNGALLLEQIVANKVEVTASNGAIKLDTIEASAVKLEANNGAIAFEHLVANDIDVKTDNGAIRGKIDGSMADYSIDASVANGTCNLPNKWDGEKHLKAHTNNGAIHITFTR